MHKLKVEEMGRLEVDDFKRAEKLPLVVVLDNVRSLHNVGSVLRTADAFRLEAVFMCGITGCPPSAEIHKTALGAEDSVSWKYFARTTEALEVLRAEGYTPYAVEQVRDSQSLETFMPASGERVALVFGNEVRGVDESALEMCAGAIEIPQFGTKHSLNVSVSVGIVLWEMLRKIWL